MTNVSTNMTSPGEASAPNALDNMVSSWARRASVRNADTLPDPDYNRAIPDFPDDLIFFSQHQQFRDCDDLSKDRLRTAAWLLFNANTIDIERSVVIPATLAFFSSLTHFPALRAIIGQTMTDESYHIYITDYASQVTRVRRGMTSLQLQQCEIVTTMESCMEGFADSWKRRLVLIATAVSTEVFVCSYLRRLGSANDIQPLNIVTTRTHLKDELAHSGIFKLVAKHLSTHLPTTERRFFLDHIIKSALWYSRSTESDNWKNVLGQLEIPHVDQMIDDCGPQPSDSHNAVALLRGFLLELGATPDALLPA